MASSDEEFSQKKSMDSLDEVEILTEALSYMSIPTSSRNDVQPESTMAGEASTSGEAAISADSTQPELSMTLSDDDEEVIFDSSMIPNAIDFALLMPSKILKDAIEALSDPTFNKPRKSGLEPHFTKVQHALFQVAEYGCEITVRNAETGNRVLGSLRLKADALEGFGCAKPFRKMITLTGLSRVLKDAAAFNYEFVVLYVEEGTSKLSFQWGTSNLDFARGRPVNIDLHDVNTVYENFPEVTYALEAHIPSEDLRALMEKLRDTHAFKIPDSVELYVREGGAVKMIVGDIATSTLDEEDKDAIRMEWKVFRDSLEKASQLADTCSVYLLTEPAGCIMLRFDLKEGMMAYISRVQLVQ